MAYEETALSRSARNTNSFCATQIAASFDWSSFLAANTVGDKDAVAYQNPPADMCSVPLTQLQAMCQDTMAKQAITAKIKSYECIYQNGTVPTLSLDSSGKLQFRSSFDAYHHMDHTDINQFVRTWLGQHL